MRAAHDVGQFQVLQDVGRQFHHLVLVRRAEVHVVIQDGPFLSRIVQKALHLRADHRIDCKIGTEHHDVILLHVGHHEVQLVVRMILIEQIFRVVLLVEEGQRQRRLRIREHIDVLGSHAVLFQERDNHLAHAVVARLADKLCRNAGASQRNHGIIGAASRHGADRLVILEDDVEHRLSDSDYFSHAILI